MNLSRKPAVILIASLLGGLAVAAMVVVSVRGRSDDSTESSAPAVATSASPVENGVACYYARRFHGGPTASGERLDVNALTAAHRTLPFGTHVKVINRDNGKSVLVRINDRGPHNKGRVIDLSPAAAEALDMLRAGVANVELQPMNDLSVTRAE